MQIDARTLTVLRICCDPQDTIKTLREEVEGLEQQFYAAMQTRKQYNEQLAATRKDGEEADGGTKLSELYMQSLTAKEALRKENQRLRRLADEYYMKNQGRLRILLDSDKKVRLQHSTLLLLTHP